MLVHIVADHPNKISDLRPLFGSQHVITSALLYGMGRLPRDCDAIIAAADLRNAENIAALKTVSTAFKATPRKIFVVDRKARLDAAQAYALGAAHVLFNPVYRQSLLAALSSPGKPQEFTGDADRVAREAALEGAVCLDSMFSRVSTGQQVDAAEAKRAAAKIASTGLYGSA